MAGACCLEGIQAKRGEVGYGGVKTGHNEHDHHGGENNDDVCQDGGDGGNRVGGGEVGQAIRAREGSAIVDVAWVGGSRGKEMGQDGAGVILRRMCVVVLVLVVAKKISLAVSPKFEFLSIHLQKLMQNLIRLTVPLPMPNHEHHYSRRRHSVTSYPLCTSCPRNWQHSTHQYVKLIQRPGLLRKSLFTDLFPLILVDSSYHSPFSPL